MTTCIIEINDIELVAYAPGGATVRSPGYALSEGGQLIIGEAARARARLQPQQTINRFWQRLSMDTLPRPDKRVRHYADLAYAHLLHLHELAGKPAEVIFSVPGNFSREQLSVLLGVATQCPFRVSGLVDTAVAAAAGEALARETVYIELQLHQAVITSLRVDTMVTRDNVQVVEGAGLLWLYDRWAHVIAEAFIRQSRFDPLHSAATEQFLYDRIAGYVALEQTIIELEIPQGGTRHRARLERDALLAPTRELWQRLRALVAAEAQCYLLGPQWSQVPGLAQAGGAARLLAPESIAASYWRHLDQIRSTGEGVSFVQRLPAHAATVAADAAPREAPAPPATPPAATPPAPTHVLLEHIAYPIGDTCYIGRNDAGVTAQSWSDGDSVCRLYRVGDSTRAEALPGASVHLNERPLPPGEASPPLQPGDRLQLAPGAAALHLIRVNGDARA